MPKIDQFESQFRGAAKEIYSWSPVVTQRVVVFTDLERDKLKSFGEQVERFLTRLGAAEERELRLVPGAECCTIGDVLAIVQNHRPDLVVTYRNLHSGAWRWPYSLSDHLEVLTQVTPVPVLLLPRPGADGAWEGAADAAEEGAVMALTGHLAGDARLVDWAVAFALDGGRVVLSHVEDEQAFDRYMDVIGRVPEIDSELARQVVLRQLLREPRDYIESCAQELAARGLDLRVEPVVQLGHRLATYRKLVTEHGIQLVVLHTKDEDQLAMHGMSYPLAIELRDIPLLML